MQYHLESCVYCKSIRSFIALPALPPGCVRNHITEPSFWCDGVLVSVIGAVGLLGNFLAIVVLSRKNIRDLFHRLLLALAAFDMMYIVFGGVNYTFFGFKADSDIFTYLFPYVIHPFSYISLTATIFMTVAITIERYCLTPHTSYVGKWAIIFFLF